MAHSIHVRFFGRLLRRVDPPARKRRLVKKVVGKGRPIAKHRLRDASFVYCWRQKEGRSAFQTSSRYRKYLNISKEGLFFISPAASAWCF
jgi:hypothetical protein